MGNDLVDERGVSVSASGKQKRIVIDIPMDRVKWDFPTYKDWYQEKNDILEMGRNDKDAMDRVASFFAKTIDKITTHLAERRKLPIEIFDIRYVFIKMVGEFELEYVLTHVEKLLETHEFEQTVNDRLR